jgi:toxin-antitoxin system PIN domain toxin
MFLVDTNVLVDVVNRDSEFHEPCRRTIEACRARPAPWYLSWPICYEFLRVCTHPRILPHPWSIGAAWHFLETLLDSPSVGVLLPTTQHAALLNEIIAAAPQLRGNILHDLHTATLMREHGIKEIYTRDMDFHRFPFLTVLDPAA